MPFLAPGPRLFRVLPRFCFLSHSEGPFWGIVGAKGFKGLGFRVQKGFVAFLRGRPILLRPLAEAFCAVCLSFHGPREHKGLSNHFANRLEKLRMIPHTICIYFVLRF